MKSVLRKNPGFLPFFVVLWSFFVVSGVFIKSSEGILNNEKVTAVFGFGDSYVDTGNNNNLPLSIAKSNFPPYGRDFMGGIPTGRFCNGKVQSDYIAEALGVKDTLPAYQTTNLTTEDLLTGVSFASGGSGFDPTTNTLAGVTSLIPAQLNYFREYKEKIKAAVGEANSSSIIAKSVYLLSSGTNDILNTYYTFKFLAITIDSYTDLLISYFKIFITELYGLGGRKMFVLNVPIIGCLPAQRTIRGGIQRNCFDKANEAAQLYNSKLIQAMISLNFTLPGIQFIYYDYYSFLQFLIKNPPKYGFEVERKGCCGTGQIETAILCNRLVDPLTCIDDTKYVFWDSFHPTEAACKVLVDMFRANMTMPV